MKKGYTVKEIAELLGLNFRGTPDLIIRGISTLDKADKNQLSFLFEEKSYIMCIDTTIEAATIIKNKKINRIKNRIKKKIENKDRKKKDRIKHKTEQKINEVRKSG